MLCVNGKKSFWESSVGSGTYYTISNKSKAASRAKYSTACGEQWGIVEFQGLKFVEGEVYCGRNENWREDATGNLSLE